MRRIIFTNPKDREDFFTEIREYVNITSWNELAKSIGKSRFMIEKYRFGKLSIPENKFSELITKLPENRKEYYLDKITKKDHYWGQILGGKKAFALNKKSFDDGRKKASKARSLSAKYEFDINMPLSEELCEFIGVIIGDGFTNRYGHMYQTQVTGDKNLDLEYYRDIFKPVVDKLFPINATLVIRKDCLRLNFYSKRLFEMLTKRFKIPAGIKCYSVKIPSEILNAGEPFVNATLRGMFNTDGGVGLDKRKTYKKPYIRVNYTSVSSKLIEQIHNLLNKFNIPHSIHKKDNSQMIQINGKENVKIFLEHIGFSNPRSLNKVKYLI
ncbi:hypothetical protein KA107_03120 [Candidatus Pacearchaeota archaeon]|nr:hypothetical protein [Candidatus Pacearchaeota archaeon]